MNIKHRIAFHLMRTSIRLLPDEFRTNRALCNLIKVCMRSVTLKAVRYNCDCRNMMQEDAPLCTCGKNVSYEK